MNYHEHGVTFSPGNLDTVKFGVENLDAYSYVRIYWVDYANTRRCRVVPVQYFKKLLSSNRPGVNVAKVALGLIYLITAPGFSSIGEYLCVPDVSTLRPLPFAPRHLAVLSHFEEKTPYQIADGSTSVKVDICPRTLLRGVVEDAKKSCNVDFLVGFESEFILLTSTKPVTPSNIHQWTASDGMLAGSKEAIILEEIANAMRASGLSLIMYHPEAAPGQYEVVSGPLNPMDAADQLVLTRELIVNVAAKHGLHATFAPRPFMTSAGTSAHTHISVHPADSSTKPVDKMSHHESAFLAGVLDHLPALPAFTLPTPASYKRMADGVWSGGTYVHYGTENREAPIRLTNATSPSSRRFEMRFVDGTANPHIVLASIIGAGVRGLKAQKSLTVQDCPGPKCAWQMTEEERQGLGITKRMPLTVEEARKNLADDEGMKAILGKEFVEKYLLVNKTLGDALLQDGGDEDAHLSRHVEFH